MNHNNGNHRPVAVADFLDSETEPEQSTIIFLDSDKPELKPAKPIEAGQKKTWKRKLFGWSLVLLLIFGGAVALYLLLRVNRVNVKVDAESRRDQQNTKPNANSGGSDNTLTSEAIEIARAAGGADSTAKKSDASANIAPTPTPSPDTTVRTNYSYTGNGSPVFARFNEDNANNNGNQQQTGSGNQPQKSGELSPPAAQNHANATQSITVEDVQLRTTSPQSVAASRIPPRSETKPSSPVAKTPPAVLPPFGAMLPVRTQGVIFTLRNNSYARLELIRDAVGTGWSLPKGTILIGRTMGGEYDRAFVNVIGYIDPRDNKLVKMSGDLLGSDGAAGIPGQRIGVDRSRVKQTLRKVASTGVQAAGLLGGVLGRGTVILDRSGYSLPYDPRETANQNQKSSFVKVAAGQSGYVMVADLPKSVPAIDAPGDDELLRAANSLTDREVMELILFGSPDEIRAATPLMSDEQKRLALKSISAEDKDK